ncbi:MAG: DUF2203 domain-containing protein [Deltaproteobacteria bacterium]|nr:DUF2203 domain-containing protein [Deltaproteobacteria bacterium]
MNTTRRELPDELSGLRVFTTEEVDALIPTLSALVSRQMGFASEIRALLDQIKSATRVEVSNMEGLDVGGADSGELISLKHRAREAIMRYEDGWTEVQDLGAVVKDPRVGWLDFWGQHEGRYVWLCWLYGEPEISYFRELDADTNNGKPVVRIRLVKEATSPLAKYLN